MPTTLSETNVLQDSIIINQTPPGGCQINHELWARDQISIRVSTGNLDVNAQNIVSTTNKVELFIETDNLDAPDANIKAGKTIEIIAGVDGGTAVGSVFAKDITSNLINSNISDGNILIRAQKDVKVGEIKANGSLGTESIRSGEVQIDANLHSSNNGNLSIGGTDPSIVLVDLRSQLGGEANPQMVSSGVKITNGNPGSTGNITLGDAGALMVKHSLSRSGWIELNTQMGNLIINGGTIDASGDATTLLNKGGSIYLLGEKIQFLNDTTINASDAPGSSSGSTRQIILAASTIDFKNASKLDIISNGNGVSNSSPATIYFMPQGGVIPNVATDVLNLHWTFSFNGSFFFLDKPLHFDGGDTADLNITADGNAVQIAITGHPIIFDGKNVQIQSKGNHNIGKHEIVMGYFGAQTAVPGIDFGNSGTFEFFVRGEGNNAAGGDIQVQTSGEVIIDAANLNLKANGPANKPGDGGTIFFSAPTVTASDNTKVKFLADASEGSTGNSQISRNNRKAIYFDAGQSTVPIGTQVKQFNFSANGGGQGGNAGAIEIVSTGTIRVRDQNSVAIEAHARGATGDGGVIMINANKSVFVQNSNDETQFAKRAIDASGGTNTGVGGIVQIVNAEHKVQPNPMDADSEKKQSLNVNALIKVDGGPNEPTGGFFGAISINGVTCAQTKLQQTWPKTIWSCNVGTAHRDKILEGANGLFSSFKPDLQNRSVTPDNPDVQLYGMDSDASFKTFFNATEYIVAGANGVSNHISRVTAVFEGVTGGSIEGANNSSSMIQATTIHELGHQLDYIWNRHHLEPQFSNAYLTDKNSIDSMPCSSVWPASICSKPEYSNFLNTEILELGETNFNSTNEGFGWLFEQQFANEAHGYENKRVDVNGSPVPYINNVLGLFSNYLSALESLKTNKPTPVN